ncbi:hypothetical protein [Streptomyces sp. SM12]|uniref:hypothetical protein n=1 Tax=Streptomyces sp. SM12 TaxID=1071602 RepID=UPI0011B0A905|nr:hypothetical protein [Streptomyces sp. SM12]
MRDAMTEVKRWKFDDAYYWTVEVMMQENEQAGSYLVDAVATAWESDGYRQQRGPYRTREAADMAYADTVHDLHHKILPTVDCQHVELLLATDRSQLIVDYEGREAIELRPPEERDLCNCGECDEDGPDHRPLNVALRHEHAREAVEAHGGDVVAALPVLQGIVEEHIRQEGEALPEPNRPIQDPLPERVTDPEERARIEAAEATASA